MYNFKIFIFIFFFLISNNHLKANQINILAVVGDEIITNFDFYNEKKTLEFLKKTRINDNNNIAIINSLIEDKLKEIEINLSKINVNEEEVNKKINLILSQNKNLEINKNIIKNIKKKIKINLGWNQLIYIKYRRQLEINMNEIDEIMKLKKIPINKKNIIINNEKNKKINIFSKIYLNELKKKYYIKKNI